MSCLSTCRQGTSKIVSRALVLRKSLATKSVSMATADGDSSSALPINQVCFQAAKTFSKSVSHSSSSFDFQLAKLRRLVDSLTPQSLGLREQSSSVFDSPPNSQSTLQTGFGYTEILRHPNFIICIFSLPNNHVSLPLHDHPGMHGVLKVLSGQIVVRSFDRLNKSARKKEGDPDALIPVVLQSHSNKPISPSDPSILLTPESYNFHQISCHGEEGGSFLDVLAPPYDADHDRDCHFYDILPSATPNHFNLSRIDGFPPDYHGFDIEYSGPPIDKAIFEID